jgi:hypothetical protein
MKTKTGYKLFEMDKEGNLYPLFLDNNTVYPLGEWVNAEIHYSNRFAPRPGLHCGVIPSAPWLMSYGEDGNGYYKGRRKGWKRVWAEVEYNCTIDYNDDVSKLKKKCFIDKIPEYGWYFFKEYGKATWIITDKIKILKVISEEERYDILSEAGYDEAKEWIPYKLALEKRIKTVA